MTGTESKMLKQHVRRGARSNFGTAAGQNSRLMRTMKAAPQICRPCAPKRAVQIQCPKGNILQADDELADATGGWTGSEFVLEVAVGGGLSLVAVDSAVCARLTNW